MIINQNDSVANPLNGGGNSDDSIHVDEDTLNIRLLPFQNQMEIADGFHRLDDPSPIRSPSYRNSREQEVGEVARPGKHVVFSSCADEIIDDTVLPQQEINLHTWLDEQSDITSCDEHIYDTVCDCDSSSPGDSLGEANSDHGDVEIVDSDDDWGTTSSYSWLECEYTPLKIEFKDADLKRMCDVTSFSRDLPRLTTRSVRGCLKYSVNISSLSDTEVCKLSDDGDERVVYTDHPEKGHSERGHCERGHSGRGHSEAAGHSDGGHSLVEGHFDGGHSERSHSDDGHSEGGHSNSGHFDRSHSVGESKHQNCKKSDCSVLNLH